MQNKKAKRESWGSSLGFMLAAIGSAVGLGNLWGFPYKLGMNGGFAFLILYLILAVFAGYVLIMTELHPWILFVPWRILSEVYNCKSR